MLSETMGCGEGRVLRPPQRKEQVIRSYPITKHVTGREKSFQLSMNCIELMPFSRCSCDLKKWVVEKEGFFFGGGMMMMMGTCDITPAAVVGGGDGEESAGGGGDRGWRW